MNFNILNNSVNLLNIGRKLILISHKYRYNNIARKILNFKTPNEIVEKYYSENAD